MWICQLGGARGRLGRLLVVAVTEFALTVLLWFGMEVLAGVIGGLAELGAGVYPLAIAMAALGGFLSYRAAKNCRIKETPEPVQQ